VNDSEIQVDSNSPAEKAKSQPSEWREYGMFLLKLAAIVLIFRSFIFSPFNIPSESMQPRLLIGDYLIVSKWPYGFSRYSLPFSPPLFEGRIFGSLPERGDVVVFKGPKTEDLDYIKRVVGLPGDIIKMRGGVLEINDKPVPKVRMTDFVTPVTQGMNDKAALDNQASACSNPAFEEVLSDSATQCRYRRFRETLPNETSYEVLDLYDDYKGADGLQAVDDTEAFVVPEDHIFVMGDNRDRSADSRFPADGVAVGMVPVDNIVGRAQFTWFSTDGSARWLLPWTWFSAARWDRIGKGF
jgi:signal peptidase I